MPAEPATTSAPRQQRRKAETRRRIVRAADELFRERGYAETSIEDVAAAADVAVRTIYLHFGSKAAIMLSYVDDWMDAFLAQVLARPVDEPVEATIRAAIDAMEQAGWTDRAEGGGQVPHPLVAYMGAGSLDIAGHVTQRWMAAMEQMATDFAARAEHLADPIDPHARAVAVYTMWISSIFAARERQRGVGLPTDEETGVTGVAILSRIASGQL